LADGYIALANVQINYDRDWNRAEAMLNRAESLEPGNPGTLGELAWIAEIRGNWDKSLDLSLRWLARDPLNPGAHWAIGDVYYCTGRYEDSAAEYRRVIDLAPGHSGTVQSLLARSLAQQGRLQEALEAAIREPNDQFRLTAIAAIQYKRGRRTESDAALEELIRRFPGAAGAIAGVYAVRGELDQSFTWWERSYANREVGPSLNCIPEAVPAFRADPRYRALLGKLNQSE
jgi:tetratricopeptide (TPR) repeat protein